MHTQALNQTHMNDTTHQPLKPALENSHSVPKNVKGTRIMAITQ